MTDAVVIGAGHNGLVAALRLARSGMRVLVVEQRPRAGGLCGAYEFGSDASAPGLLFDRGAFPPTIAKSLGLERHGLEWRSEPPLHIAASGAVLNGEPGESSLSGSDLSALKVFQEQIVRVRKVLQGILTQRPPKIDSPGPGDLISLLTRALTLRSLGKTDLLELVRILPMSVFDWLNEAGFSGPLAESLASEALWNGFVGPRAPGTASNLLFAECVRDRFIRGGSAALVEALLRACKEHSVEIRTGCRAERIRIDGGRVSAVVLQDGEEVETRIAAASCDPREACLRLIAPGTLRVRLEDRLWRLRGRGTASLLLLCLDGPPEWRDWGQGPVERVRIGGGSLDDLERCYDAVKYGAVCTRPFLEARFSPSEGGRLVATVLVLGTPRKTPEDWSPAQRESTIETVLRCLGQYAPGLEKKILARQLLTPADLQSEFRIPGGNLWHVEPALDQLLFMRPVPEMARYRTPVEGLFLAGSGSHPGGGVTGLPGYLATGEILK